MNRTTPITISGQIFHLEDEGYELLRDYLDSLATHFSGVPEADEIMADIEARVAERLAEIFAADLTTSIPPWRVNELMDGIGRPEDFEDFLGEGAGRETRIRDRRLFRDHKSGLVAGVASGLGAYLGLDANLVRAAFVISGLLGGAGAILYLVLWLVIPPARSSSDRLRMQGTPVTAPAIAHLFPGTATVTNDEMPIRHALDTPLTLIRRLVAAMSEITSSLAIRSIPFLRNGMGVALTTAGVVLVFLVCLLTPLLLLRLPASYLDPVILAFLDTVPYLPLILSGAISLLVPATFLLVTGISLLRARSLLQPTVGFGLVGVWFIALLVAGLLGTRSVMEWQSYTLTHPLYERVSFTLTPDELRSVRIAGGIVVPEVREGVTPQVLVTGRRKEVDRLAYSVDQGALHLELDPSTFSCVLCDREFVWVTVTVPVPDSVRVERGWHSSP